MALVVQVATHDTDGLDNNAGVGSLLQEVIEWKRQFIIHREQQQQQQQQHTQTHDRKQYNQQRQQQHRQLKEQTCQVASLALGNYAYYMPFGRFFLGLQQRKSTAGGTNNDESKQATTSELQQMEKEATTKKKRGILQRVVDSHRSRREERKAKKMQKRQQSQQPLVVEEMERQRHPLRHILEEALAFSHWKKMQKELHHRERIEQQQKQQLAGELQPPKEEIEVDWNKWKYAMSDDYDLPSDQSSLVKELAARVLLKAKLMNGASNNNNNNKGVEQVDGKGGSSDNHGGDSTTTTSTTSLSGGTNVPNKPFSERVDNVPWGGVYNVDATRWWPRKDNGGKVVVATKISGLSEGGRLLAGYLKIMKWPKVSARVSIVFTVSSFDYSSDATIQPHLSQTLKDLFVKFPFKLCSNGCNSEVAILHTLEWREKYKPWCMSPSAIQYNKDGFIYFRGHSKAGPKQRLEIGGGGGSSNDDELNNAGHSMIWYRPALGSLQDPELYVRTMIHTLDSAVADSLLRNQGTIGRFNVVLDCKGVGSKSIPSMTMVKKLFGFLQDHFPDRLGVLLVANLSGMAQMIMKMVLPFVTEDVRAKIHILPGNDEDRRRMLLQFIEEENVPVYFGGNDEYVFDINEYYSDSGGVGAGEKCVLSEDEIRGYLETMPYHA